jgi:hypothetical protein
VIIMSEPAEATSSSTDGWPGLLEHYRESAVLVLARHQAVGTLCGSCGQPWPCRAACAAEQTLEL